MENLLTLAADPLAWTALGTLIVMEVVLGIDNLVFISILANKLPENQRDKARKIGIALALILRLGLLSMAAWLIGLTETLFTVAGNDFSWRDLILISGGLFLVWKATMEIHHKVDVEEEGNQIESLAVITLQAAIFQIIALDLVFSIDSIVTAVGMTPHLPIMVIAVIVAVTVMLFSAGPLSEFLNANPSVVMLALGFLLMIGMTLIADGFGYHVPKGYIYAAMAFSGLVEALNMASRRARKKRPSKA